MVKFVFKMSTFCFNSHAYTGAPLPGCNIIYVKHKLNQYRSDH